MNICGSVMNLWLLTHSLLSITLVVGLEQDTVDDIRGQIRQMINEDTGGGRRGGGGGNDIRRMIAGLVRLSFHDCVGLRCDGCINNYNPENAGLDTYINETELLYSTLRVEGESVNISRADFWALAGIEAVKYSSELATCMGCEEHAPNITFYMGREDCPTSPWTDETNEFPSALGDTKHVLEFFDNQFGFNEKEATAILGAHTLGQAHGDASGFVHPWVRDRDKLSNAFYIDLNNPAKGWHQTPVGRRGSEDLLFWENEEGVEPKTMMLNSDIALIKNLSSMTANGEVACTYDTCQTVVSDTKRWVEEFAADNDLWIDEFSKAFQKMIGHGWDGDLYGVGESPIDSSGMKPPACILYLITASMTLLYFNI